ncbi:acylase [Glaciecola siphonariae]|uniref:Acylase n=1 Tax=Glaciecola siphonariae TaxID=521012 RepID=A0ABV9LUJ7_9ALTE
MKINTFDSVIKPLSFCAVALALMACGDDKNDFSDIERPQPPVVQPPQPVPPQVPNFDPDGVLEADIRWTEFGVPHVKADNLESMSYGVGYAFARDNLCILADQIVKYNSERSKYLGPDRVPGSGDSEHLINDFGFLTVGIREQAEQGFARLSANSRALYQGYVQGYNKYLEDTGVANIDPQCAGQAWIRPIDEIDLLTYALGVALLPGNANFLGAMFIAAPQGVNPLPRMVSSASAEPTNAANAAPIKMSPVVKMPERNPQEMGSNGWGLGSQRTENGMGMVLGNPHFPHTGNLRFWQFQTTIPGFLNVIGGSLMGIPGVVNIGYNDNVAWTHTFSTAEHFVVYQLQLDDDDASSLTHIVDGAKRTIFKKTYTIDVAVAPGQTIKLEKDSYFTNYGPMINVPGNFEWGPDGNAFAIKDANLPNFDIVDHWLAMNLAKDMDEFKQAFVDYDGVIFNNTMAASKSGEVFYIDDSTVPNLTPTAIDQLTNNPLLAGIREAAGFTVLPGFASVFDYDRAVPYENAPKYEGLDYVQNSNDSFWLTNLENPITGVNPLYGKVGNEQSLRSRMAHVLLNDAAGSDGKFSPSEVEEALLNNRSFLADAVLPDLLQLCQANRESVVVLDSGEQVSNLGQACDALSAWDGLMNADSTGAHVFREFAFQFNRNPQWLVPFDVEQPVTTPRGLALNDLTLKQLATAVDKINQAGIAFDASLGEVQFVEKSTVNGMPSGERFAWGGAHNAEGGFNVFDVRTGNNGTELPRHTYPVIDSSTRLSAQAKGYHITYGSSWMMVVNFTEDGPVGRGLLSYSQSNVVGAESFDDQTQLYSSQPTLRPLRFTEAEIAEALVEEISISSNP